MTTDQAATPNQDFLAGGGAMGALMRAHDWSTTALGPPQAWPQAMRTAIRLILNTGHPMYVWWGPDLLCFYNDAYSASIGPERHPGSLGQPAQAVWREIWDVIGPQIRQVMTGGGATWHENQLVPITRHGRREDVYWTYSFGPIDDHGASSGVGGVLMVCTETTASVLAVRHRAEENARQRRLFQQAPGFIVIMRGARHTVDFVNDEHRQLFDSEDWIGKDIRAAFPDIAGQGYFELLDQVYASGQGYRASGAKVRFRPRGGDQDTRFFDFMFAPLLDDDGAVTGVFCQGLDVSERIHSEAALRESEARFSEVANAAPVLIWIADASRGCIWFNTPWLAFTGRSMAQECGHGWAEGVHPDDLARRLRIYDAAFDRREAFRMDYRLRRHDGEWRTVDDNGVPRFAGDGTFLGYIGSCIDVTEHRITAAALRGSEGQLRLATETAEIGLWDVDVATDILFWTARVKGMFGISPDVPVSMRDFYEGLHPDDRERTSAAYAEATDSTRRARYDVEYRTVGKEDGVVRWVAAKGRGMFDADGRCLRVIGTAIDITERKVADQRLRESQASLAESVATLDALIASAPIGFAFFDTEHRYIRLNAVLADMNGLPIEAHIGRRVEEVLPVATVPVGPTIDRVVASGQAIETLEIDGETPGRIGEARSWLTSFFPVRSATGTIAYVGVTVVDITARRRAEAAVREMNQTLEALVAARTAERDRVWRNSRDLLVVVGIDGVFRAVSPSWTILLGHAPEDVVGQHLGAFVCAEDEMLTRDGLERAAAGGNLTNFENRYRHKDGTPRWISWHTSFEDGLIFAYGRDITAEKDKDEALAKAEDALRQAQKMEAVGQLTGGIAHDFNNLLQGVAGSLDLIRRKPDDAPRVLRWAEAGLGAAQRGAKLTAQLLAFSRSQKLELKPVAVSALVSEMRDLLNRTLGPAVRLRLDLEPDELHALGDETQLEMAVLNLAINARDAMPDGGALTITTRAARVDGEPQIEPGDYVELSVTDSGVGMAPNVVTRAFDPFFTTKDIGKGTGLGLSQVYGMVRQAGGGVRIDSRPGAGTTVRLFLCRTGIATAAVALPDAGDTRRAARAATVLVVDDDPDVRRFLLDSLDALGYRALEAEDGYAGLAALARSGPDAMIVDFAMPGMTGAEVARNARLRRPDLPIIFASGFSDTVAIESVVGKDAPILRKPFRVEELHAMLVNVLERAQGPR